MANLKDLFVSKVRVKLIQTFLKDPSEMFYVRQLVRSTNEEINAVRRELARMEERGLVKKEPRGNRLYYFFVKTYPFYQELISLTAKTVGLGADIIKHKNKIGNIKFAMLSGRYARQMPRKSEEDIDLLVVGAVNMAELNKLVRKSESVREKEINYAPMAIDEFQFRCCIGKKGLTKNKKEGDKKTPKGTFSIEHLYFREDRIKLPKTYLKTIKIKADMGWCDDINFPSKYNKLIKINKKIHHEKLFRDDYKYDLLIPIKYNFNKIILEKGSCIFIHLTNNYNPTVGCITFT